MTARQAWSGELYVVAHLPIIILRMLIWVGSWRRVLAKTRMGCWERGVRSSLRAVMHNSARPALKERKTFGDEIRHQGTAQTPRFSPSSQGHFDLRPATSGPRSSTYISPAHSVIAHDGRPPASSRQARKQVRKYPGSCCKQRKRFSIYSAPLEIDFACWYLRLCCMD
jgi:hypothetical protein